MALRPYWTQNCCASLGTRATIVSSIPDTSGENLAIVTFEYTDMTCDVTLLPAINLNGSGAIVQLPCCRWAVYAVPYNSTIIVLMRSTSGLSSVLYMKFTKPCCCLPAIQGLTVDNDHSGATRLVFTWDARLRFAYGFTYALYAMLPNTVHAVEAGSLGPETSEFIADGLTPGLLYKFVLTAKRSRTVTCSSATTFGITFPEPSLSIDYFIYSIVGSSEPELATVTICYKDSACFCVSDIQLSWNNTPLAEVGPCDGGTRWQLNNVPYGILLDPSVQVTANAACPFPPTETLRVSLPISIPSIPVTDCSLLAVTNLQAPLVEARCITFTWDGNPELKTYVYQLTANDLVVRAGASNNPYMSFQGLDGNTEYVMTVTGECQDDTPTAATSLTIVTLAATEPRLPPIPDVALSLQQNATYTATFTYAGALCVTPVLSCNIPNTSISNSGTQWTVAGLPPNTRVGLTMSAAPIPVDPCDCDGGEVTHQYKNFKTPAAPTPTPCPPIPSTCVSLTSSWPCVLTAGFTISSPFYKDTFRILLIGENDPLNPIVSKTVSSPWYHVYDTGIQPDTLYTLTVTATCTGGGTVKQTAQVKTSAAMEPAFLRMQQPPRSAFALQDDTTYTLTYTYPFSSMTCIQSPPTLSCDPAYVLTQQTPSLTSFVWTVAGIPPATDFVLTLRGLALTLCGCAAEPSPVSVSVNCTAPSGPAPPTSAAPYKLTITNYAGPPAFLVGLGKLEDGAIDGSGPVSQSGSYQNQWSLHNAYATHIVSNFVAYNMQSKQFHGVTNPYSESPDSPPIYTQAYGLPISAIYYGCPLDPYVQGASEPPPLPMPQKVLRCYAYANSSSDINQPDLPYQNFKYPPLLAFFLRLIEYNWEVATNPAFANKQQVQLAFTLYGSKNRGEQWYFGVKFAGVTDGTLMTDTPQDPKTQPSCINGAPNDYFRGSDERYNGGGWNCMERWFMYVGYCNQQLRYLIQQNQVVNKAGVAMTIDNIIPDPDPTSPAFVPNSVPASCAQISAVTCDGEGNGFPNANFPRQPNPGEPSPANCNAAIKALWDKWVNQIDRRDSSWPTDVSPSWEAFAPATELQARKYMPTSPAQWWNLPCKFSTTTIDLIGGMEMTDLGTPDYDAINARFPEVYDTSSNFSSGSTVAPVHFVRAGEMKTTTKGLDFNVNKAELYDLAVPKSSSAPYATALNTFGAMYGTWDNLVGGKGTNRKTVCDGDSIGPDSLAGSTAAQNSFLAFTPLMNTSTCNPWIWTNDFYLYFQPATQNSDPLAWALESSRYDLYHGQWAAQAASNVNGAVDYSKLKQKNPAPGVVQDGTYTADGELLWTDLSTGLKPYVYTQIQNLTPSAAAKVIWQLSTQSGPFVNNCGVEYDARPGNAKAGVTPQPLLTFTAPDITDPTMQDAKYYWPGWKGMKGQWYGPGNSANAGFLQQWATDQMLKPQSNSPDGPQIVVTGSTEDNFGVFQDICVIERAWSRMAMDLRGETIGSDGKPISGAGIANVKCDDVNLGCYELAFIPLSWYDPAAPLPVYPYYT